MEIGFELESAKTVHFTPNHRLKMYLTLGDEVLPDSVGTDVFDYNGALLPDAVIAATGRNAVHKYQPGLEAYNGESAVSANVDADDFSGMTLWLENNLILSQGDLQTYYTLRAIINGKSRPVPLMTTKISVNWESMGKYAIQLKSLNGLI